MTLGQVSYDLDLSGDWWAGWQTWKDGHPRIDTHTLEISQRGEVLQLLAERATCRGRQLSLAG
jgi:hypothetical protein